MCDALKSSFKQDENGSKVDLNNSVVLLRGIKLVTCSSIYQCTFRDITVSTLLLCHQALQSALPPLTAGPWYSVRCEEPRPINSTGGTRVLGCCQITSPETYYESLRRNRGLFKWSSNLASQFEHSKATVCGEAMSRKSKQLLGHLLDYADITEHYIDSLPQTTVASGSFTA